MVRPVDKAAVHIARVSSSAVGIRINCPRSIHLGCRYGNSQHFLEFLNTNNPQYLYLVGDILDGWRLARNWYWLDTYNQIIHRLNELAEGGTEIFYTPGNHDEFLREFLTITCLFGKIRMADQFVHTTADDRRLMILHGDQFDRVVSRHRLTSGLGDRIYDACLFLNRCINRVWDPLTGSPVQFSKFLKEQVKKVCNKWNNFEGSVINYARVHGCSGVVCGHIHRPCIKLDSSGLVYCNTGDWVENMSAIIESDDGQLAVIHFPPQDEIANEFTDRVV